MPTSKRDAYKAQRTRKKRQQRMNTMLWVGGFILIFILILITPAIYNSLKPAGDFVKITPVAYPMVNGKTIGNPNAKVKIEVFEDFQCPACKGYTDSVEKQLLASSYITNGQVNYIFRQFPFIDSQSATKESHQAANASMCAMEQSRFWDYHDILFTNQGVVENGGSFNNKRLVAFAESLGLDMTAFNSCFNNDKYSSDIEADYQMGQTAGINSTPSILINGANMFPSHVPTYEELTAAIDATLTGGG
jgi:protein-disulfide isomerase